MPVSPRTHCGLSASGKRCRSDSKSVSGCDPHCPARCPRSTLAATSTPGSMLGMRQVSRFLRVILRHRTFLLAIDWLDRRVHTENLWCTPQRPDSTIQVGFQSTDSIPFVRRLRDAPQGGLLAPSADSSRKASPEHPCPSAPVATPLTPSRPPTHRLSSRCRYLV